MKRLIYNGKIFVFVETFDREAPALGDKPRMPQKASVRPRIRSERLARLKMVDDRGNGYRPGTLLDLAPDQCRFTIRGKTMCGAKCGGHPSYCDHHAAVCQRGRVAWDSVRMKEMAKEAVAKGLANGGDCGRFASAEIGKSAYQVAYP